MAMVSFHFTLLLLWGIQDSVTCVGTGRPFEIMTVAVGDRLVLNCTYNCSNGFVQGCWSVTSDKSGCRDKLKTITHGDFCTVPLIFHNMSTEDVKYNYTCYTEDSEDPRLPQKRERAVSLKIQVEQTQTQANDSDWMVTPETDDKTTSPSPRDSEEGEFTGIKVLATVTIAVAMVLAILAVYLCMSRNRKRRSVKGKPAVSTSDSSVDYRAVPSPANDDQSDTEVPYADIMITVRGASTPELTQISYLTPGDQRERWRDETGLSPGRSHLQASRSADRLHVHLREVSRKMSTNSEYAVITYS